MQRTPDEGRARLARLIIARAQETKAKGIGDYSLKEVPSGAGAEAAFPQATTESADFESFFRFFPDYLVKDALKEKEVLDFGCGYGGRTVEYKLCGAKRVCGVEPFENVIELSRRYAESRGVEVEFKVCGHRDIPYPDASFDIVLSYDVLEHVEDPRATLAEIRRVLRPGGLSLNVFPVYFGAISHHLDYIVNVPGLHWLFSARTLIKAVNRVISEQPGSGMSLQPEPKRSFDGAREVLPSLNGLSGWHLKDLFADFETVSLERHPLYHLWPQYRPWLARITGTVARSSYLPFLVRDAVTHSIACVLRKPGPADAVPLPAPRDFRITPVKAPDWEVVPPARIEGDRIVIHGPVTSRGAYAALSPVYKLGKGAKVGVNGNISRGGLTFGLLDASTNQWSVAVPIPTGRFRRFVEAPADGKYRITIANNLPTGPVVNHAEVYEAGFVDLASPEQGVGSTGGAHPLVTVDDIPVDVVKGTEWDLVSPAQIVDDRIIVRGAIPAAGAYAALSPIYKLPKGVRVSASGAIKRGGLSFGLLDVGTGQWAVSVSISSGRFRRFVEVPVDGEYRILIANNVPTGRLVNDAEIDEVGFFGTDIAEPPES